MLKLTAYAGIHDPDDHVSRENFDNDLAIASVIATAGWLWLIFWAVDQMI
ncbi:MAG TPA: hypothetical protein VFA65_01395 [Bryobacteraceae bacterium]|nr:hypothetical protein [Bryobacteraceae bacterium]